MPKPVHRANASMRRAKTLRPDKAQTRSAPEKAIHTGQMAVVLAKALASRANGGWKLVDFGSKVLRRESRGVVDVIAIRKWSSTQSIEGLEPLDLFEMVLIQSKGGSAKAPTDKDIERLRKVANFYRARSIVLFEWIDRKRTAFYVLDNYNDWIRTPVNEIFPTREADRRRIARIMKTRKPMTERDIALWDK